MADPLSTILQGIQPGVPGGHDLRHAGEFLLPVLEIGLHSFFLIQGNLEIRLLCIQDILHHGDVVLHNLLQMAGIVWILGWI